jgi:multidrug resistance efflux pump
VKLSDADAGVVRPLRPPSGITEERLGWSRFRDADTPAAFHASWLDLQCRALEGVEAALLLVPGEGDGNFEPAAAWPSGRRPARHLLGAAKRVVRERRAVALQLDPKGDAGADEPSRTLVGQPVEAAGELVAVVVLEVTPRAEAELERTTRQLAWGTAWLALHAVQGGVGDARARNLERLLDVLATPLEHRRYGAAATAFVTQLATSFGCERVSLGAMERGRVKLRALSHSARFGERANVTRSLEAAMEEALDQECAVSWPPIEGAGFQVTRDHEALAKESGAGAICSVPVALGDRQGGVVCFERGAERPFEATELRLVETAVALAGPVLELQRREDRTLASKALESAHEGLARLVGPRHVALKLVVGGLAALALAMALMKGDHRVTAETTLEAQVLRAAVAPFDGYITDAPLRAGDLVGAGDTLVVLDDRELLLERASWSSQLEQVSKQYRAAMAERDAPRASILTAQMAQMRAELDLVAEQLEKTRIRAPFDGVLVTGDLSQSLGAPVERGQVLFEVAPLEAYRVILKVDERDIDELAVGQGGRLALSAFPDEALPLRIEKLTPISEASAGVNTFRVEASLGATPNWLRPGMEGVAKVDVGRRRLLWIWTHEATDWLRLTAWRWLP